MTRKQKVLIVCASVVIAVQIYPVTQVGAKQVTVDSQVLEQLQHMVLEQQERLEMLEKQLKEFQQTAITAKAQAREAKAAAEEAKTTAQTSTSVVTSGSGRVKLAVSGQVNRAMSVIDDGGETDVYFVDNDSSNSRIRFVGTAMIDEDLTLGSKLELALAPNVSSGVNQNDHETNDFFDERVAELFLASKQYGTLYFGKGSTASDDTAEVDLSGTGVIQYSSYDSIAGGMLFREKNSDMLTGVKVSSAFNNFDGLSRKSRLRYDLPTFHGFGLSGSVISDSRWDTALRWSGSGYGFKVGAAAAIAYINTTDYDYQYDGSFSMLHEDTGLNFTFSGGSKDADSGEDPYGLWAKIGWTTTFCPIGTTSFGIDYGHTENLTEDGDEGNSFGIAMVQSFADYGTEVYFQFRQYSLDREVLADVEDINVGTVGARVKF